MYEAGGASALGGVVLAPIHNTDDGELDIDELKNELSINGEGNLSAKEDDVLVDFSNTEYDTSIDSFRIFPHISAHKTSFSYCPGGV